MGGQKNLAGYRWFESISLQRRVSCEPEDDIDIPVPRGSTITQLRRLPTEAVGAGEALPEQRARQGAVGHSVPLVRSGYDARRSSILCGQTVQPACLLRAEMR